MRAAAQRKRCRAGDVLLGRYRIVSELGQGGMGVVYRCFDEVGGIEVALKALPPELSHNSVEMEEVRENFRLVEGLHHPAIAAAKTLERDEATGDTYLIMECVEGVNLRQWRKRRMESANAKSEKSRALDDVLPVLRQLAEALDYAHSRKIIHRDIKPSNVMIAADGTVKVLDFGLAAQIHTSMSRVSLAHYGTSGTGPYMAPEQWRGQRQDARADQYALAATAYELLAGAPPFENPDPGILREAVLKESPKPVAGLDKPAWIALQRALAKEPERRFPDCTAFVTALGGGTSPRATGKVYWVVGAVALAALAYGTQRACDAYRIRRDAEAATAQAALQDTVQRGKTGALRRAAEAALDAGDLQAADSKIRALMAAGGAVGTLEARCTAYGLSNEAARVRARVAGFERDPAVGQRLDALESAWQTVQGALASGKWADAADGCRAVKAAGEVIEALDASRAKAREAQTAAQAARAKAAESDAATLAGVAWQAAEEQSAAALKRFQQGDFDEAARAWKQVASNWEAARLLADQAAMAKRQAEASQKTAAEAKRLEDAARLAAAEDKRAAEAAQKAAAEAEAKRLEDAARRATAEAKQAAEAEAKRQASVPARPADPSAQPPVVVTPATTPPPPVKESPDTRRYYQGTTLAGQPQREPLRFVAQAARFRKVAEGRVADARLGKTWALYQPNEIMTFENARQHAASLGGRLPTLAEAVSLLVLDRESGDWARINGAFFPKHQRTTQFWSDETRLITGNTLMTLNALRWMIDFSDGTASKVSQDDQCGVLVLLGD